MCHTPGPWENHKWNSGEHQISAKGGIIALVSHYHSLVSEDEADANGRLITAAPELLTVCKRAVSFMRGDHETNGIVGVDAMLNVLNAAISKAEPEGKV